MLSGEPLASGPLTAGRAAASPPEYSWPHGYCDRAALMRMWQERGRGEKCHTDVHISHKHTLSQICTVLKPYTGDSLHFFINDSVIWRLMRLSHSWIQFKMKADRKMLSLFSLFRHPSDSRSRRSAGRRPHHAGCSSSEVAHL